MKSIQLTKKLAGILAGVLVFSGAAAFAATYTLAGNHDVEFNADSGEFIFGGNTVTATDKDGKSYPSLFQIEDAMPGDTFEWDMNISVTHLDGYAVKMYLTMGDYYQKNLNGDTGEKASLADTSRPYPPVLTATFDTISTTPTNIFRRLVNTRANETREQTFMSYAQENDPYGVYLGEFRGTNSSRNYTMSFSIPKEAGNEYSNIAAEMHWVFTAEVIELSNPGGTDTPGGPTGGGGGGGGGGAGGGLINIEEETVPLADHPGLWISEMTDMLENGQTLQLGDFEVTPDMLGTPWMLEANDHYAYLIGYEDDTIRPFRPISRAEVATVLFRCMKEELRDYWWLTVNDFNDVPSNAWYNNAISTLANAGILFGYEDGSFRPNEMITRAEFCAMIGRYYSMMLGEDIEFSDIRGHWAEDIIRSVSEYGFVEGYEDGTFRPSGNLRRCEIATIMNRILNRHVSMDGLHPDMKVWQDNADSTAWYYLDMQEASNTHDYSRETGFETWTDWSSGPEWENLEQLWSEKNSVRIYRSTDGGIGS